MKKLFMYFLSLFLPWVVLLIYDNPGGAVVALIMQATVIGWPFATIWAWGLVKAQKKTKRNS